MRAKMSEPGKTRGLASYLDQMHPLAVGYPAQRALVDKALREAHAIMEETEPREFCGKFIPNPGAYLAAGYASVRNLTSPSNRLYAAALADSLAALCAAEDPEAYLREGQKSHRRS